MNLLILGGTGFIGSKLTRNLLGQGYHIRIMDRTIKPMDINSLKLELIEADYTKVQDFKPFLQDIDIVFHFISTTVPATSNIDKIFDINTNVCSTLRLLEDMRQTNVKKIIFLSSGGTIYGHSNMDAIPEEHPTNPLC
ncbi:NAD-dependent epimerase/dehydratase family protein, partial [Paenibacillus sp. MAH-36]|uniref:NAD-dependent epimerase/dehydratase family protein n=1 Tax=Paenibacillus sp. GCM10012304 TaxID=3317341 RepID=UPI003623152C